MDKIHIKDSATSAYPLCDCNPGSEPMAWTSRSSARILSDCADCLKYVLRDGCSICDGSGEIRDFEEAWPCRGCDEEAAEEYIARRNKKEAA